MKRKLAKSRKFKIIQEPISSKRYVRGVGSCVEVNGIDVLIFAPSLELLREAWADLKVKTFEEAKAQNLIVMDGRNNEWNYS